MATDGSTDAVESAVAEVTHPEIDATLMDLGMIQGIEVAEGTGRVTLALPMLNIPDAIKQILVSRIAEAVQEAGAEPEVEIVTMTDQQREQFFQMEQEHWTGLEDEEPDDSATSEPPF